MGRRFRLGKKGEEERYSETAVPLGEQNPVARTGLELACSQVHLAGNL